MPKGEPKEFDNAGDQFTPKQCRELLVDAFGGKKSIATIVRETNRSKSSIETKLWKLCTGYEGGLPLTAPPPPARAGARCQDLERDMIKAAFKAHKKGIVTRDYMFWIFGRPFGELDGLQ